MEPNISETGFREILEYWVGLADSYWPGPWQAEILQKHVCHLKQRGQCRRTIVDFQHHGNEQGEALNPLPFPTNASSAAAPALSAQWDAQWDAVMEDSL